MSDSKTTADRNPWFALALSLLAIGVGHVYCGRIGMALALFAFWFFYLPIFALLSWVSPSQGAMILLLIIPCLLHVPLYFGAAFHAFRLAHRSRDYVLKDYNRASAYLVLVVLGLTYPLLVLTTVRNHFFEAYVVPTNSMAPNIVNGDRLLCNRGRYKQVPIQRGDLVVFHPPGMSRNFRFVKRVVALGGDLIEIRNDRVWLNEKPLDCDPLSDPNTTQLLGKIRGQAEGFRETNGASSYAVGIGGKPTEFSNWGPVKLAPDAIFVLGDLRTQSRDSRDFGPVPVKDVIGRLEYCYFPAQSWNRMGVVK